MCTNKEKNYNLALHQLVHGGGSKINTANRWFDKIIQIVINENGINGVIYEHTIIEGQPVINLMDYIQKDLPKHNNDLDEILLDRKNDDDVEMPKKLLFNFGQQTIMDIQKASNSIDK